MMDSILILILAGFFIGTIGTLIGAGGGFILVPLLILTHPEFPPAIITAVSMAIVACNAISGSIAYSRSGRIDFKAGILFALFTIPGSILGVVTTEYIPKDAFRLVFGVILILLASFLFFKPKPIIQKQYKPGNEPKGWKKHELDDKNGIHYSYSYNQNKGILISIIVGYLSPLLGIGGGIIHVPALVQWLHFPVFIATATSHFILAVMSTVSVIVHILKGSYSDPYILRMVICICIGVIGGAQLGAYLSHKLKGNTIIRALAICLGIVGLRILLAG